jgi:hypothetical protein
VGVLSRGSDSSLRSSRLSAERRRTAWQGHGRCGAAAHGKTPARVVPRSDPSVNGSPKLTPCGTRGPVGGQSSGSGDTVQETFDANVDRGSERLSSTVTPEPAIRTSSASSPLRRWKGIQVRYVLAVMPWPQLATLSSTPAASSAPRARVAIGILQITLAAHERISWTGGFTVTN